MNLLAKLKKIPVEHHNYKVYHSIPKENCRITEVTSEIINLYEQNEDNKYQSIFFKYNSENILKEKAECSLTVAELIEILEHTVNENITDIRFFYIPSYSLIYDCSGEIKLNNEGENPCYVICD